VLTDDIYYRRIDKRGPPPELINWSECPIESAPPARTVSMSASYDPWEDTELPQLSEHFVVTSWKRIGSGTHGYVRKITFKKGRFEGQACIKLFNAEHKVEFEREARGYAALVHRGVRRCVLDVYDIALRTREGWDSEQPSYGDTNDAVLWDCYGVF